MRYIPLILKDGVGRQILKDFKPGRKSPFSPSGDFTFIFDYCDEKGRPASEFGKTSFEVGSRHGVDDIIPFLFETSLRWRMDTVYRVLNSHGEDRNDCPTLYGYHFNLVPESSGMGVELTSEDIEGIQKVVVEKMRDTDNRGT